MSCTHESGQLLEKCIGRLTNSFSFHLLTLLGLCMFLALLAIVHRGFLQRAVGTSMAGLDKANEDEEKISEAIIQGLYKPALPRLQA